MLGHNNKKSCVAQIGVVLKSHWEVWQCTTHCTLWNVSTNNPSRSIHWEGTSALLNQSLTIVSVISEIVLNKDETWSGSIRGLEWEVWEMCRVWIQTPDYTPHVHFWRYNNAEVVSTCTCNTVNHCAKAWIIEAKRDFTRIQYKQ